MVKYQNIEHQQISDKNSLPEHQNDIFTGGLHRANSVQVVNRLETRFNGKCYDNVQLTSTGENKKHEWSHDCLRIVMNVMLKQMSVKKRIKLFKERAFAVIVKEYTQPYDMHVFLTPQKNLNNLEL